MAVGLLFIAGACGKGDASDPSIDLLGEQFPILKMNSQSADTVPPDKSPCDTVRALGISELDAKLKSIVKTLTLECEVGKGIEGEPDAVTNLVAELKPSTATFGGVPIVEIRMMDSAWGNDYQYVLDVPFSANEEQLTASVRKHCQQIQGSSGDATNCPVSKEDLHHGIYIDSGESGGLWAHPDPDNAQRTIFASAWSE
jgi:hypothetical protein